MTIDPAVNAVPGSDETTSSAACPDSEPLSPAARLASFSPSTPSPPSVGRLSDVEPDPVLWLSPGSLGIGKVTVLDGETAPSTGGGLGGE